LWVVYIYGHAQGYWAHKEKQKKPINISWDAPLDWGAHYKMGKKSTKQLFTGPKHATQTIITGIITNSKVAFLSRKSHT
jgi:hypothetical protein